MKPLYKTLKGLALAVALFSAVPAQAQFIRTGDKILDGNQAGNNISAVSTDTAILIRYIGTDAGGGEVTVAAGGDITLTVATVADATTECPVAGGYGGVITVADASCNTLGEVVDAINFSANWRAVLVGGLRSDSSNNTLFAMAITPADSAKGLALKFDTAVALTATVPLVTQPFRDDIRSYLNGVTGPGGSTYPANFTFKPEPFDGLRSALFYYTETITSSGGAGNIIVTVYDVVTTYARGRLNAAGTGFVGGTETATPIYSALGGATTVNKVFDFSSMPQFSSKDGRIVVRIAAGTDLTAPSIQSSGVQYKY